MGIIVRNMSGGFSNVRIDKLYNLDEYGIIGGKKMYYLVHRIKHTQQSTLNADESIIYNEQGEYFILWNDFHPVKVWSNTTHDLSSKVARVDGFTSTSQPEPYMVIILQNNISISNPAILNIKFTKPVLVNHLHLRNRQYSSPYTLSFRDFTLEGSNDNGDSWEVLLDVAAKSSTLGSQFNYSMIDNKKIYSEYRFVVTRTYSHSTMGLRVVYQSQINLLTTNGEY